MDRDDKKEKEQKDTKVMDEQGKEPQKDKEKSKHDEEADKIGSF